MTNLTGRKKEFIFLCLFLSIYFFGGRTVAFSAERKVDYGGNDILDSDLDGLTDEGERQIYFTDPNNPDSDGDGFFDGAEAIGETDPKNYSEPKEQVISKTFSYGTEKETPWAWYLTRATALISFFLLWSSIFLGVAIRLPVLRRIFNPIFSVDAHCWVSLQALFFAAIHGGSLLFDRYIGFSFLNIAVPFFKIPQNVSDRIDPGALALGVISFYLMSALVLSSYFRKRIPFWLWRSIHFLNIGLYVAGVAHALKLGADLQGGSVRLFFVLASVFLAALLALSIFNRFFIFLRKKKVEKKNENIRESDSQIVQE
jgi:DMSO/TMAO reductase YedYZ heme-binding membrane subunit